MLSIYRRHREECPHAADRISSECRCGWWATGTLFGQPYRKSLKTRNKEAAERIIRKLEKGEADKQKPKAIALKDACNLFITSRENAGSRPPTMRKLKRITTTLQEFAGNRNLDEIDAVLLTRYTNGWKDAPITQQKKMERLRSLFKWFEDRDMIAKNPARGITITLEHETAVEPFEKDEQEKIIATAYRLSRTQEHEPKSLPVNPKTGTFARLLLSTALRITDAATLTKDRFQEGRIFLYATKNKKPVTLPLPPDLVNEIAAIPSDPLFPTPGGSQRPETVSDYWRDQLIKVFTAARIKGGHPHRFRHSMAVNMLNNGSSVEDVALVLGNSPAIVAKHYSAFVKSRQERINAEVKKTWTPALVRVK